MSLGAAARRVRESRGLSQKEAAELLSVSNVHLCNVERGEAIPSQQLVDRMRELWGIDIYVLSWCLYGDVKKLPAAVREPAMKLAEGWKKMLGEIAM